MHQSKTGFHPNSNMDIGMNDFPFLLMNQVINLDFSFYMKGRGSIGYKFGMSNCYQY